MSKLKNKNNELKLHAGTAEIIIPEKPHFSFEYLTTNNSFTFDYFGKDKHNRNEAKSKLIDRLIEISQKSWLYWQSLDKEHGIETLNVGMLNFSPSGYTFSSDEKFIVF